MKVQDYMTKVVRSIAVDATVVAANQAMEQHGLACLAVINRAGQIVGAVSRIDLLRIARSRARVAHRGIALELPEMTVEAVMSRPALTISAVAPLQRAAAMLVERRLHRLFVTDGDERPIGVLSATDVMRAVRDARIVAPLSAYMSSPVETIEADAPLGAAAERLAHAPVSGLVVTEGALPVGLFTQREALESMGLPERFVVEDAMSQALFALPMETPLFRAAGFTCSTRARRVLCVEHHHMRGLVSGLDFARAFAAQRPLPSLVAERVSLH